MPEEVFETPQPVQPAESTVGSKPHNWPKVVLAAVLGLGLLAGSAYAGYYYGTQQVQQPEKPTPVVSQPSPKTTPTPTPEPTTPIVEDETKDWKTFESEEYGFGFKYPSTLQVEEKTYAGEKGYAYCLDFKKSISVRIPWISEARAGAAGCWFVDFGMGGISIDFEEGRSGGFTDTRGYRKEQGRVIFEFAGEQFGKEYEIPQELVKRIYTNPNQVEVVVVEGETHEDSPFPVMGTPGDGWLGAIINTKHPVLTGLAIAYSETTSLLSEEEFYQILSTFKFLD